MTFLIYIFSFLILISIIVFIHELGHFSFARLFGVRVLDFSIGFGRSIKSWETKSKTIFNLRLLPFGGYVKMNGEEISDKSPSNDSYSSKKYYQKLLITLGGPIFNFILAVAIFFIINLFGTYKTIPIVGDVLLNSIANEKGIEKGDLITKIDNDSPLANLAINNIIIEAQKRKIKTPGDLDNIMKSAVMAKNKSIVIVIYNNQNQKSYIGVKLD